MINQPHKLTSFAAAFCLILAFGVALTLAQTSDLNQLTAKQVIERELKGDDSHSYSLALTAGQYLDLVVEQKGVDVVVTLFDVDGKKVIEVDTPDETQGAELILLIVETSGNYRLEVRSLDKTAAGRYEVKINELRIATEKDKTHVAANTAAQKALSEAIAFYQRGTAEALRNAIIKFEEALQLWKKIGEEYWEGYTAVFLGAVYENLGEKQKALDVYTQILPLIKAIGDKNGEAVTLNNIGNVYIDLGEKQKALDYFNQALPLRKAVGDKRGEAKTLNNIGEVYSGLGEKQKALDFYTQALLLSKAVGDKSGEATTLINIGSVYSDLGEKQKALDYYTQALPLYKTVGDKSGEAATHNNIGGVYYLLGEKQKALDYYAQNLLLVKAIGNKRGEATTLNNIGGVYSSLGEKQQALIFYNESLPLRRAVGDKRGEAITLRNMGKVYSALDDKGQALKFFNKSLPLSRVVGDKRGEANTLESLFDSLASVNPRFAIFYAKQSVNNFQVLRSNVQGLDKNLQQSFLKSIEDIYRRLADALIVQGRYAEAQQVLNSFKDQQFFDFSQSRQFEPLAVTVREAELTAVFNQKLENVAAAIRAFDAFKRTIGERPPTADENTQLKSLADKQSAANADYLTFLRSADKDFAAPPADKDKFPDVPDVPQLQTALRELSAQTGEKSVAIYTLVGADNYRTLVVTPDSIISVSTPIKGALLNQKAQQLWRLLKTPLNDPQPLAKEIYDVVFAPLAALLPADTKTILWSLDGNLRYLPMAALHDGRQYLVERYNNVVFTRADKERLTRSVSTNLTGTGFGGSQRHTVKLGKEVFKVRELPAVKTELARIFKTDNSTTGTLSGEVLLDEEFTRATMISTLQKRRPLVHIASHFKFEPGEEANSFLLLGDGTAFTLGEMKQQKDLFAGVELLTLSACDTAAQREGSTGREVDGFAELAQRLGAGAVMASLWEVQDESTSELMGRFYKTYNNEIGTNKATSLRLAQLALLHGEYKSTSAAERRIISEDAETVDKIKIESAKLKPFKYVKNRKFAHPYYWSPFILIGNWK